MKTIEYPEVTDFIAYLHLKNLAPATIKMHLLEIELWSIVSMWNTRGRIYADFC